jgi:hypothetical protein
MGEKYVVFKTGDTPIANADGITYNNFGAGVMFTFGTRILFYWFSVPFQPCL